MSYSQSGQDLYVLKVLNEKKNGFFLEIGSNHPIKCNNTYKLEKEFGWSGIMVEYNDIYSKLYDIHRPNSSYIINDATKINYIDIFKQKNYPNNMDYLQIDLDVDNGSTINTLQLLNDTLFDEYKFAVVTFEHDIYRGNHYNTHSISRYIFENRGYMLVFPDVMDHNNKFEDWYIHPDLVDINYINKIKSTNSLDFLDILRIL